ncbi:MAG: DUF2807 domain-containing protein [Bacteroidales bacterium]|nr:DUF2807 domain-containing protein [Bacteroidales bacterium]
MYGKIYLFTLLSLFFSSLLAQESVDRSLNSFTRLEVGDRVIVRLVKGTRESANIRVQGIDASAVKTEVVGNTLTISIYGEPFTKKKVTVTLNYVNINAITVTGGADVSTGSLFKTDTLEVDLKSGGMLFLDSDVGYLTGKIIEGALLTAEGYATEQDIVVATSGTLSAYDLESDKAKIKASSGGKAKIYVEEELDAQASSKGFISYKGKPSKINSNATSGGIISVYEP